MEDGKKIKVVVIVIVVLVAVSITLFAFRGGGDDYSVVIISKTEYYPGETGQIIAELRNATAGMISATCYATILYPNKTIFVNLSVMNRSSLGTSYYVFVVPDQLGVYEYNARCSFAGRVASASSSFHVGEITQKVEDLYQRLDPIVVIEESQKVAYDGEVLTSGWRLSSNGEIVDFYCLDDYINISFYGGVARVVWVANRSAEGTDKMNCILKAKYVYSNEYESCYQEDVNIINQTGLDGDCPIYTGTRSFEKGQGGGCYDNTPPVGACIRWYDGDWSTYSFAGADFNHSLSIYLNYTKPKGAYRNLTRWETRERLSQSQPSLVVFQTIPVDCWDAYPDKLVLGGYTEWNPVQQQGWRCFNGTDWVWLQWHSGGAYGLYEEAMNWSVQVVQTFNLTDFISVNGNVRAWVGH